MANGTVFNLEVHLTHDVQFHTILLQGFTSNQTTHVSLTMYTKQACIFTTE